MCPEPRQIEHSAARCSATYPPRPGRAWSCCAYEATQTLRASAGQAKTRSRPRLVCSALASAKHSPRSWKWASFSSSHPEVRAAGIRRDIWSSFARTYWPLGSPYFRGGYGPLGMQYLSSGYGPLGGHEVITTHVPRSTGLSSLDVVRPTHRPTRPHPSLVAKKNLGHAIGQLAARCPSGEEAQRDLTLRARKRATRHLPAWLRSCPLPGAPADYSRVSGSGLYLLAVGTRDKRDVWGLSAQPKVRARGGASAPLQPSAHKTLPAVIYLPPRVWEGVARACEGSGRAGNAM